MTKPPPSQRPSRPSLQLGQPPVVAHYAPTSASSHHSSDHLIQGPPYPTPISAAPPVPHYAHYQPMHEQAYGAPGGASNPMSSTSPGGGSRHGQMPPPPLPISHESMPHMHDPYQRAPSLPVDALLYTQPVPMMPMMAEHYEMHPEPAPPAKKRVRKSSSTVTSSVKSSEDKKHSCEHCGKIYGKLSKLQEHVRSHTGERPFVCDAPGCGKTYIRKEHLVVHRVTHADNPRPFGCENCDARFGVRAHLTRHLRKNRCRPILRTNEQTEAIQMAQQQGSAFPSVTSSPTYLNGHGTNMMFQGQMSAEIGSDEFPCEVPGCGKSFKTVARRKDHAQRVHAPRTSFVCSFENCEAGPFTSEKERDAHTTAVHVQWTCDVCGHSFANSRNLKEHQKLHKETSAKEVCPLCDKMLSNKRSVKVHMRAVHQGFKAFECPSCEFATAYKKSFRKHLETHMKAGMTMEEVNMIMENVGSGAPSPHPTYNQQSHSNEAAHFACPVTHCQHVFQHAQDLDHHIRTFVHTLAGGAMAEQPVLHPQPQMDLAEQFISRQTALGRPEAVGGHTTAQMQWPPHYNAVYQ